ncbi:MULTISPECIES: DMT family transporter [Bombella]|uniref:Multidrug transporter n=2 Tax=Bombella TaxID=1654741 RepID=A0A1S8GNU7_9PROT|nr:MULTISPECIES: multidrug efflux SMR transporter [Bombella]MBA5726094.1 QacE family quaternary ammonium compound efflux SMR transporter [Bombella favorum]OOL17739.1 multidrug transporter [Bombella intestini]
MTPFLAWLFLFGAILLEVLATSLLNISNGFRKPLPTIGSLLLYGAAFFCLAQALKCVPLGIAYAVWCGVGIVCIAVIGVTIFRQPLNLTAYLGIGLILLGTLLACLSGGVRH